MFKNNNFILKSRNNRKNTQKVPHMFDIFFTIHFCFPVKFVCIFCFLFHTHVHTYFHLSSLFFYTILPFIVRCKIYCWAWMQILTVPINSLLFIHYFRSFLSIHSTTIHSLKKLLSFFLFLHLLPLDNLNWIEALFFIHRKIDRFHHSIIFYSLKYLAYNRIE